MTDHSHHHEHPAPPEDTRALRFALGLGLNIAFVILEATAGLMAQSMALVTDAAHNLSDVLGLALAWWASALALRQPTEHRTYGFRKATILAALANATLVLTAVGAIGWEALSRLTAPPPVQGKIVMAVAVVGVVVNSTSALLFLKGRKTDINIRGVFVHLAADAAISLGVVVAGVIILATGLNWIDPVVSLSISAVIVFGTWSLLKGSLNLIMDGVPPHVKVREVSRRIRQYAGVTGIHDLHIWALSSTETALSAHISTESPWTTERLRTLCADLEASFGLQHTTIQIEPTGECTSPCPQKADGAI